MQIVTTTTAVFTAEEEATLDRFPTATRKRIVEVINHLAGRMAQDDDIKIEINKYDISIVTASNSWCWNSFNISFDFLKKKTVVTEFYWYSETMDEDAPLGSRKVSLSYFADYALTI